MCPFENVQSPTDGSIFKNGSAEYWIGKEQTDRKLDEPSFAPRLNQINNVMTEHDLMPALDPSHLPPTLADAAMLFNGKDLGIPEDGGRSSGSAVSMLLKASGAEVKPTMDIGVLHDQLKSAGWHSFAYKAGDQLNPGDLLFTSLDRQGRNVGIVGSDGQIYSFNGRSRQFEGRNDWSSNFIEIVRAPATRQ